MEGTDLARPTRLRPFTSPAEFRARAGSYLLAHEAEHNLLYGIASAIEDGRYTHWYLWVLERDPEVIAVALRTPPHNLVLSLMSPEAARVIADSLFAAGHDLPGVVGPNIEAAEFAHRWSEHTGRATERTMAERVYALSRVLPTPPVPGRARPATRADLDLLVEWLDAFNREAHVDEGAVTVDDLRDRAEWFVGGHPRVMLLWEDDGEIVSMAGSTGPTPNGIRVGPVYTAPERRARGYASACVAELSRRRLAEGYRFCFLFTDLANPTSNSIYQRIGYEPVCDVDVYRFTAT